MPKITHQALKSPLSPHLRIITDTQSAPPLIPGIPCAHPRSTRFPVDRPRSPRHSPPPVHTTPGRVKAAVQSRAAPGYLPAGYVLPKATASNHTHPRPGPRTLISVLRPLRPWCNSVPTMARHPRETKDLAKALFVQGLKYSAIAAHIGVGQSVIRSWAMRGKWNSLVASTATVVQQVLKRGVVLETANNLQSRGNEIRDKLSQELAAQAALLASSPPATVAELGNSKHGQGRASIAKTIADAAGIVHDWGNQGQSGLVLVGELSREPEEAAALDIAATVTQAPEPEPDPTTGSVLPDAQSLSECK